MSLYFACAVFINFVAAENGCPVLKFDDWKAFSNNNYLRIEALKAKIEFAFDLMRTVKTEKESKKDKYHNIDSNNNKKKCSLSHKLNACLKFILVQFSLSYKLNEI